MLESDVVDEPGSYPRRAAGGCGWGGQLYRDSNGTPSGVTVTWDSNNTWRNDAGSGTPDNKLMHGYLDATGQTNVNGSPYQFWWNENKPEAYVTGLGAWLAAQGKPRYAVVVYSDGDTDFGRLSEYWLQEGGSGDPPTALGSDLSPHVFIRDDANFAGAYQKVPISATTLAGAKAGNYVVFRGIAADSFILRTEEQDFRATINGFQVVAVPEPASAIGLIIIGLALSVMMRRSAI
jgi:hypothetical protein